MNKILIFGGSSSIGNTIFKELNPFYDLYATYFTKNKFRSNKRYVYYNLDSDPTILLKDFKPDIIISGLKGNFKNHLRYFEKIIDYCEINNSKLMFISSSNVFDSFTNFPSYEEDKTFSRSLFGRFNIHIENKILRMKNKNWSINRSAMIFGKKSKRIVQIMESVSKNEAIEIFPNLIVNINSEQQFAKQLHYIISRKLNGIFHHGSKDLINHEELIKLIISLLKIKECNFKYVFTTNENRHLSLLSKKNKFPNHLSFDYESILSEIT